MSNKLFFITWENSKNTAVAYAPQGTPLAFELINQLEGLYELPFNLELKTVIEGKNNLNVLNTFHANPGAIVDYQPNSLAWPLMSDRMRKVIDKNMQGGNYLDWIEATVVSIEDGINLKYFIPRFKIQFDIIDKMKTIFVPGTDLIIKPHFLLKKIVNLNFFNKPSMFWQISSSLYVSNLLRAELVKNRITGISFEKVSFS